MKTNPSQAPEPTQSTSGSIVVWKWKSVFWMLLGFSTMGGQRVTLSWSKETGQVEVRDENNVPLISTPARLINRYYFNPEGAYTLWLQNTPHYFAIRNGRIKGKAMGRFADIIDNFFFDNLGGTVVDLKSNVGDFKKFLDEANPDIVGFAPYRTKKHLRGTIIAAIVIVFVVVIAGTITGNFGR